VNNITTEQYEQGYNHCRTTLFSFLLQSEKDPHFDWFHKIKKVAEYDSSYIDRDRYLCCHKCQNYEYIIEDGIYDYCKQFQLACDMVTECAIKNKDVKENE